MASSLPPEVAGEGRDHGKSGKLLQSDNAQSLGRNGMGCFFLSACSYAGRVDRRSLAKEERCFDILRHQKSIAVQCLLSVKRELGVSYARWRISSTAPPPSWPSLWRTRSEAIYGANKDK
ncbi:hypothetical protein LTR57_025086 [Friedmanniomyces endolithicus]|nr:hypothetical protein LTR57_025086 [Friedmanniomyces endolithicus]KAK0951342.1 hypothetical protein LTS01_025290 [Friedmanniomyces endolithicus]